MVTIPTETITEGLERIDGITYDFKRFVDAESDLQLAALLPEQKVLMAFDLVFSPNEHAFTVVDHFDHWMIILESLKVLQRSAVRTDNGGCSCISSLLRSLKMLPVRRGQNAMPSPIKNIAAKTRNSADCLSHCPPAGIKATAT